MSSNLDFLQGNEDTMDYFRAADAVYIQQCVEASQGDS